VEAKERQARQNLQIQLAKELKEQSSIIEEVKHNSSECGFN
jgi:hypothetical protein